MLLLYTLILLRRHCPHALVTWCRALDACFEGLAGMTAAYLAECWTVSHELAVWCG